MNENRYINFTECCIITGLKYSNLQWYKRTGRFVEPIIRGGFSLYDRAKVEKWNVEKVKKKLGPPFRNKD